MNEQEFIRRMKNKGVKLNDQQLKGAYRQYLKDPEPFRDLVRERKPNPFLEGLTGKPDTGTKVTAVPTGQAKIKEKFLWDDAIEPKEKKAAPGVLTMEQALADNWKLMGKKPIPGISPYGQDDASVPGGSSKYNAFLSGLDGSGASAGTGDKPNSSDTSQDNPIDFDYWDKIEQFNKKRREIQFDTSLTKEEKEREIAKLRDELLFKHEGESLNVGQADDGRTSGGREVTATDSFSEGLDGSGQKRGGARDAGISDIPIVGPDGAPDENGINPKTGNFNIGGYDLTKQDINIISNILYSGFTPEESVLIFAKLKQTDGNITDKDLTNMGIKLEDNWFNKLLRFDLSDGADLLNDSYQAGNADIMFAVYDQQEREKKFNEAIGVIMMGALNPTGLPETRQKSPTYNIANNGKATGNKSMLASEKNAGYTESIGKPSTTTIRVGRWMSQAEYDAMVNTGKVQESSIGTTYVASPNDINAFGKQTRPRSIYVEFDIPENTIKITNKEYGWAKILGPNTIRRKASC